MPRIDDMVPVVSGYTGAPPNAGTVMVGAMRRDIEKALITALQPYVGTKIEESHMYGGVSVAGKMTDQELASEIDEAWRNSLGSWVEVAKHVRALFSKEV